MLKLKSKKPQVPNSIIATFFNFVSLFPGIVANLEMENLNQSQDFGAAAVAVAPTTNHDGDLDDNINDQTSLLSVPVSDIEHQNLSINHTTNSHSDSNKSSPLLEHCIKDEADEQDHDKQKQKVYREVILVTIAVFMGYASLVVVQKKLYNQYEANNGGSLSTLDQEIFEHGTSLVYFGNLCFRLLHNVIFAKITPRNRVVLSLLLVTVSMSILVFMYFVFESAWVGWVYIAYLCGGVAIGSFESNLLSTITPLVCIACCVRCVEPETLSAICTCLCVQGPDTKVWAIIGMPVGFTCISVVGFAAMGVFGISVVYLYIITGILAVCACFLWLIRIPIPQSYNQQDFGQFLMNLKLYKEWLPKIKWYAMSLTVDMFMVSFFSAINQYILDGDSLPIFGSSDQKVFMDTNDFFSIYSVATFIGDTAGRKIIYYFHQLNGVHPSFYLILSVLGAFCCILKIPFLTWLGMFLIFFANGLIYAASTKFIDKNVDKMFSLTAISFWLFIGDIGSVTGSNIWQFFQPVVCHHGDTNSAYFCVGGSPTSSPTTAP